MTSLHVEIHVDATVVPRWKASVIDELRTLDGVRTTVHRSVGAHHRSSRGLLARLVERVDRRMFRQPDDASDPVAISAARASASAEVPDVVLWLGAGPAPTTLAGRHGVWEFRFSGGHDRPSVTDVLEHHGTSRSALVDAVDGAALYESWAAVDHLSPHRHRHSVSWKTARFPARVLGELLRTGTVRRSAPAATVAPRSFGPLGPLRLMIGHAARYGALRWRQRREPEAWRIGVERKGAGDLVTDGRLNVWAVLEPPSGWTWADPSVVVRDDTVWVFMEEITDESPRGRITAVELDDSGAVGAPMVVLEGDCHLSYPHVFEWDHELWMVPESSEAREVVLYRCDRFPDRWVRDTVLLEDCRAADATLHHDDDGWWLFAAVPTPGQLNNWGELHLYHADTPRGPWAAHRANPVVSDCRRARPAGRLFELDGVLYRPAQNCAPWYGTSTVLHRVEQLSLDAYVETPVQEIRAEQLGARRTHTLDVNGWAVAYDLEGRSHH